MKFAFLVHPLGNDADRVLEYLREVNLSRSFGWDISAFVHDMHSAMLRAGKSSLPPTVQLLDELPGLVSRLGSQTEGRLYQIPMDSFAILEQPDRALEYIFSAIETATGWGAEIVGLGSMTGIVGGQGTWTAERSPIPVTTGNSLTVYAAVENLFHACSLAEIDLGKENVVVVGVPGSIAAAAARILRPKCGSLRLVARAASKPAAALAAELDAELMTDLRQSLARHCVVLTATSSGGCIDPAWLSAGTIVSDVAVPTDIIGSHAVREDCLFLSGGLCRVPETMPMSSHYLWFHRGAMAACLAETIVLALDASPTCLSLGRQLAPASIAAIGQRAQAHGFTFSQLYSFGMPLEDSSLIAFQKTRARRRPTAGARDAKTLRPSALPAVEDLGRKAAELFRRHINPAMLAIGAGFVMPIVKGQGARIWDADGKSYLDFVGGYGSLNLGHNHPEVVAALKTVLSENPPGFSPAAINPYAAALAEQLAMVAPSGLEMIFLANSGTEAVEASLKLARHATGRRGLLYCERSFHGKTLGSLSVTGNHLYQRPFEPLVPECQAIPFGDTDALEQALRSRRFAAFVVEPVQAEGGMIVPPPGYLQTAQELCRATGTLLAIDEVQTGFGRTGTMFAVDRHAVEPDLMAVAKSLSGGLVPIGAMLSRREQWRKAYGSVDTFALHTSTFGGGSLACAAGLTTLRILRDTDLIAQAADRGQQLWEGLRPLVNKYSVVRDVRGQGLLLGIEFNPPPESIIGRLQGLLAEGASIYLVPGIENIQHSLTALYVVALLKEYGIYTQVARSNPSLLRVEPPLVLTEAEVDHFISAIDQACREVESLYSSLDQMIAKAVLGQHGSESTGLVQSAQAAPLHAMASNGNGLGPQVENTEAARRG